MLDDEQAPDRSLNKDAEEAARQAAEKAREAAERAREAAEEAEKAARDAEQAAEDIEADENYDQESRPEEDRGDPDGW